jgi:hypothetical protein
VRENISLAVIALVWAATAVLLILADHSATRGLAGWASCRRRLDLAEQMLGEALAELSTTDPGRTRELARQYKEIVSLIPTIDREPVTDVEQLVQADPVSPRDREPRR